MDPERKNELTYLLRFPPFNLPPISDESLARYNAALTHSQYAKESRDRNVPCEDNERLEFFGDRALGMVVAEYIFKVYKDEDKGAMARRMEIVSNENLARIIKEKMILPDTCILMGQGGDIVDNIRADAFEALIGAIYLDQGIHKTEEVVLNIMKREIDNSR